MTTDTNLKNLNRYLKSRQIDCFLSLSSSGDFCVKEVRTAIDDMALPSHPEPTSSGGASPCVSMDFQHWTSFSEWEVWFSAIRLQVIVKSLMEGVFYVAWWFILGFRNRSIFDDNTPSRSKLFDDIVSSSFLWCNSRSSRKFSRDAWLKNPHLISL
ncbi:hypothetical protein Tco_0128657 [Tanacetum coccineum]